MLQKNPDNIAAFHLIETRYTDPALESLLAGNTSETDPKHILEDGPVMTICFCSTIYQGTREELIAFLTH